MKHILTISFAEIALQIVYNVHQLQLVHHAYQDFIRQLLVPILYVFYLLSAVMVIIQIV